MIIDYNDTIGLIFGEITKILIENNHLLFLCFIFETIGYNSHVHGYEILKNYNKIVIKTQENLFKLFPIYSHRISNGEIYCILKYSI